jgi:hypothetical protein
VTEQSWPVRIRAVRSALFRLFGERDLASAIQARHVNGFKPNGCTIWRWRNGIECPCPDYADAITALEQDLGISQETQ